ncbi:hypothetical protein PENTCL1PPCAC_7958, partial [Pristionchus entomophagus]
CTRWGGSFCGPCRLPGTTRGGTAWRLRRGCWSTRSSRGRCEGVAGDGDEDVLLGVEHSGGGVDSESLHVGGLEGPSDTASGGGALKTILVPGWVAMSPGGTDWAMST